MWVDCGNMQTSCVAPLGVGESPAYPEREGERKRKGERERKEGRDGGRGEGERKEGEEVGDKGGVSESPLGTNSFRYNY